MIRLVTRLPFDVATERPQRAGEEHPRYVDHPEFEPIEKLAINDKFHLVANEYRAVDKVPHCAPSAPVRLELICSDPQ